jgi:hypothetical protein
MNNKGFFPRRNNHYYDNQSEYCPFHHVLLLTNTVFNRKKLIISHRLHRLTQITLITTSKISVISGPFS